MINGEALAQSWKYPNRQDGPAADHPSGEIKVPRTSRPEARAALLLGAVPTGVGGVSPANGHGLTCSITTISPL